MKKWVLLTRRFRLRSRRNTGADAKRLSEELHGYAPGRGPGISCPIPALRAIVRAAYKSNIIFEVPLEFTFDSGAEMMMIPISKAQEHGISFRRDITGRVNTVGGTATCFYDVVQVQSTLSGRTHRWPCCFVDTKEKRMLIGRAGFLDEFAIAIKNDHLTVGYPVPLWRYLWNALCGWITFRRWRANQDPI